MMYNLIIGFLVLDEEDSSDKGIGSSIGEGGHV